MFLIPSIELEFKDDEQWCRSLPYVQCEGVSFVAKITGAKEKKKKDFTLKIIIPHNEPHFDVCLFYSSKSSNSVCDKFDKGTCLESKSGTEWHFQIAAQSTRSVEMYSGGGKRVVKNTLKLSVLFRGWYYFAPLETFKSTPLVVLSCNGETKLEVVRYILVCNSPMWEARLSDRWQKSDDEIVDNDITAVNFMLAVMQRQATSVELCALSTRDLKEVIELCEKWLCGDELCCDAFKTLCHLITDDNAAELLLFARHRKNANVGCELLIDACCKKLVSYSTPMQLLDYVSDEKLEDMANDRAAKRQRTK